MPALKVHVRPPHRHRGLMILCAFYGITFSCIAVLLGRFGLLLAVWLASVQSRWGPGVIMAIIMIGGVFVPPLIVACSLARSCQHKWPTYLCGQIVGSCMAAAGQISQYFLFPGSYRFSEWWEHLVTVLGCLAFGAAAGLGYLLVRFLYVNFVSVLVEQDGTLCVKCGYCIARSSSERCSECGAPVDTPLRELGRIQRFAEFLGSHATRIGCLAILLVATGAAFLVWHQLPVWRFSSTIAGEEEFSYSAYVPAGGRSTGGFGLWPQIGREVEFGSSVGLLVVLLHRPAFYNEPLVQLRIATQLPVPGAIGTGGQPAYYMLDGVP